MTSDTPATPFPNVILLKMLFPKMDAIWNQDRLELIEAGDDVLANLRDWVVAQMKAREAARKEAEAKAAAENTDETVEEDKPVEKPVQSNGGRVDTGSNLLSAQVVLVETRHLLTNLRTLGYKLIGLSGFVKKDRDGNPDKDKSVVSFTLKHKLEEGDGEITEDNMPRAVSDLLMFVTEDGALDGEVQIGWTSVHVWDNRGAGNDVGTINLDGPSLVTGIRPLQLCADSQGIFVPTTHGVVNNDNGKPHDLELLDEPESVILPVKGADDYKMRLKAMQDYRTAAGKKAKRERPERNG